MPGGFDYEARHCISLNLHWVRGGIFTPPNVMMVVTRMVMMAMMLIHAENAMEVDHGGDVV